MSRTFIRQETQVRNSDSYDDSLSSGSGMEPATNTSNIEVDLNNMRSQLKRWLYADSAGNWYDDVPTVNTKKRGISGLNTDLDDIEEKRLLFRTQVLTDISVDAAVQATGTLTLTGNAGDTETVTIDTKVYTFQTVLTDVDGHVLIGATASDSLDNLIAAITLGAGSGTLYAASTTLHPTVTAAAGAGDTMDVTAHAGGTSGNTIATTETLANGSWGGATLSGGDGGDLVILSVSGSEAPSETAAVGAVSTQGAVVAYNATFATATTDEVAGPNTLRPKNLCIVRDATTLEPVISSNGYVIYALIQSESNTDGHTFDDSSNRVQLSFVEQNSTGDDLVLVDGTDMGGKTINYGYVRRIAFDSIPETAFLVGAFIDQAGSADVTLDNAIDNQSGPATQTQDIEWRISDTYTLDFQDSTGGTNLLSLAPTSGGDTVSITSDDFTVTTTNDSDFTNGMTVDSAGTDIQIGVVAGQINTTSTDDFDIQAGGELYFDDGNRSGSTWATDGIKLSESSTEWDDFETAFGEVSLFDAVIQASKTGTRRTKIYAACTSTTTAGNDVGGSGGGTNLDAQLPDMSAGTFLTDYDTYLNGEILRPDTSTGHDYYAGTSLALGQLKFTFTIKTGDVLCVIAYDADDV